MEVLIFLRNLRRNWLFLLLFSLLPSLTYGLFVYFSPRTWRTSLQYQLTMTSLTLEKLQERLYCGSNLDLILGHLRQDGAVRIAALIQAAESEADLRAIFDIRATPDYIDYNRRANLKLSLERSWADNVKKLEELKAQLVKISIQAAPQEEVLSLARWLRHNFKKELTLYDARDDLVERMNLLANAISQYEQSRAYSVLARSRAEETLSGLKAIPGRTSRNATGYQLNLNFENLDNQGRFLPLDLQVQAYSAEVVRLGQVISSGDRQRDMQRLIYAAFRGLIQEIDAGGESAINLDVYLDLVKRTQENGAEAEVSEHLGSHLTWLKHLEFARSPLTATSRVQPMARGTVRLTIMNAIICLMVGIVLVTLADLNRRFENAQ